MRSRNDLEILYRDIYKTVMRRAIPAGKNLRGEILYSVPTEYARNVGLHRELASLSIDDPDSDLFKLDIRNFEEMQMWLELQGYAD